MSEAAITRRVTLAQAPQRTKRPLQLPRQKGIVVGGGIVALVVTCALLAPQLATHDPSLIVPAERLQAPSRVHVFGTDGQGRDVFSRVLFGARLSLGVGFAVVGATLLVGAVLGLLAGFYRPVDAVAMRMIDGMMAFPDVVLAIAIMAVRGPQVSTVVLALTVVAVPGFVRVVRSVTMSLREQQFVEAARASGADDGRILVRHVLPNALSPIIVQSSFVFAAAVLGEATLSFLGAGVPPEVPSWGVMLNDAKGLLRQAPWAILFPGAAITLTVLGLNLLGDGLRDLLDPRLRS